MRKIIAVLLAVLMLASVLAMVPAFAASYDGTTATSTGMHGLIITEIAQHTHEKDGLTQGAYNAAERAMYVDCAGYIEVLNNTGAAVDFSTLALLRGLNFNEAIDDTDDPMYKYVESWVSEKKFLQKMVLKTGNIISVADRDERYSDLFPEGDVKMTKVWESLENSADDFNVANGKAAVIWFVNEATVNWLKAERDKNISGYDAREVFVDRFYGTDANAADYNIIMVWANSNEMPDDDTVLDPDMFTWDVPASNEYNQSVIIGLADATWDLATDHCNGAVNPKIKSIAVIGNLVDGYAAARNNASAIFAPANTVPALQNKKNTIIGATTYADYVAAGLAMSYAEVGAVNWASTQTPGKIDDWQYAMMAAALVAGVLPASVDEAAEQTAALNAYFIAEKLGDEEAGRQEDKQDHNYVDRSELEDRFSNSNKEEEGGIKLWVILVIVGGAVLVLAAAAVVVFVVILPKKKAAAAAAVEGEEATEEEAPAEEAPAEEATEE